MHDYNESEKYENYCRVMRHIQLLRTAMITEDVLENFKRNFRGMRDEFPNYSLVNADIRAHDFRSAAARAEAAAEVLEVGMRVDRAFNLEMYMVFLQAVKTMVEHFMDDDDLAGMMSRLTM
jgi:hypothetical protein